MSVGQPSLAIRPSTSADADWIRQHVTEQWCAEIVVAHGEVFHPHQLPGFIASWDGDPVGLVTYRIDGNGCEIVTIDSTRRKSGMKATDTSKPDVVL